MRRARAVQVTLHIGVEKTGTSSIQGFLNDSRSVLLAQGVLFPIAPGKTNQTRLPAAAMLDDVGIRAHAIKRFGPDFDVKLVRELQAEIAGSAADRLLLSSEHCAARLRTVEEVQRLKTIVETVGGDVTVLIYLRRQDEFLTSIYSTAIRSGHTERFRVPTGPRLHRRYDYRGLLELWSGVFGRAAIKPRLFQPRAWVGGQLLTDFCHAGGLDVTEYPAPLRNESMSGEALELLRLINTASGVGRDRSTIRAAIKVTKGPKLSIDSEKRRAFMRHFDEGNRWVAETFFGRSRLFEEVPDGLPDHQPPELSPERFAALRSAIDAAKADEAVG